MTTRVVVVGGGISGLAAALRLMEAGADVRVLEAGSRAGGILATERTDDGFVIERGPDSILVSKPAGVKLAERVGLASDMVGTRPSPRGAYIVAHGRLERVPEGFSLLAPTRLRPFLLSPILSVRGKARAALDLVLPRGPSQDDESLASFVTRRFGGELLERLAQPLVGGIYGADPAHLSLRATMPRFLDVERAHRSVSLGLRQQTRARSASAVRGSDQRASGARYGLFVSFTGGIQMLPDAVAARLGDRVRTGTRATHVVRRGSGWRVGLDDGKVEDADAVVLALPAWRVAELVQGIDPGLGALLGAIPYGSAATATFAFRRGDIPHPMDGFGFVVPDIERRAILACTWASVKYEGRAPRGKAYARLLRRLGP